MQIVLAGILLIALGLVAIGVQLPEMFKQEETVTRSLYVFKDAEGAGINSTLWMTANSSPEVELATVKAMHSGKDFVLIGRWKLTGKPREF